jgi:hypothetical protein
MLAKNVKNHSDDTIMNTQYYESIELLEKSNVSREFVLGWAAGYLGNPQVEEQRRTEAYVAGFAAGAGKSTEGMEDYVNAPT